VGSGSFRAERQGSRADHAVFVACLALSLTALALPEGVREPVSSALRGTVLLPLLQLQERAAVSAAARQNVAQLRAARDSLSLAAAAVPMLESENARLRGLLGLGRRLGTGFVTAEVLHQAGVSDGLSLVLSAGSEDGIVPLSPVVTAEGLLGVVRSVDRRSSVALAWTHPDFRASAMVEGRYVFGIVAARRESRAGEVMELRGVAYRDVLPTGTLVVTSGLGGVFPRGIPVGTVEGVLSESAGWQRTYLLKPAVHPAAARHALILVAADRDTLTGLFADSLRSDSVPAAPLPQPPRP
jgi:rod shape-determining protein MreC